MRSTLTIDDQIDQRVRQLAEKEHLSYKDAINQALKTGLDLLMVAEAPVRYQVQAFDAGFQPGVDQGSLNRLADSLEANE